jgi:hypothetical protein
VKAFAPAASEAMAGLSQISQCLAFPVSDAAGTNSLTLEVCSLRYDERAWLSISLLA